MRLPKVIILAALAATLAIAAVSGGSASAGQSKTCAAGYVHA